MKCKERPELNELLETVTRATADGRMLWKIVGCDLHPFAVSFLCETDWCHFRCWDSREEGKQHLSIFAPMEAEVPDAELEFLTADVDSISDPRVGTLYRCLVDRFPNVLEKRLKRMRRGVSEINRKLVEALAEEGT